jgi:transposase
MKCVYCQHHHIYLLSDGLQKCGRCKRKFSPAKLKRENRLLECFWQEMPITQASELCDVHYLTARNYYLKIRRAIAVYSDKIYHQHLHLVSEFDEYFYLPKSLKGTHDTVSKIENFLTLCFEEKVYTIMMPSPMRYTNVMDEALIGKFLRYHKVIKLQKSINAITAFWDFFEDFILKFRGVSHDEFYYYLKEAEFLFNHTKEEQIKILRKLMNVHYGSDLA